MLTPAQIFALGTDIRANDGSEGFPPIGQIGDVAAWYNTEDDTKWAFKTSVDTDDALKAIDYSEVLNVLTPLSDIKRWAFDAMMRNGDFNPTIENNRDALVAIFSSDYSNTRAALLSEATRHPTRCEVLFMQAATGPAGGDGSSQTNAAALVFEGDVTNSEIDAALEAVPE